MISFIGTACAEPSSTKAVHPPPAKSAASAVNPVSIYPSDVNDSNILSQNIVIPLYAADPRASPHFLTPNLIINSGTTINWVNNDIIPHQISYRQYQNNIPISPEVKSPLILPNGYFSVLFNVKGDYGYFCSIHPYAMNGFISVK